MAKLVNRAKMTVASAPGTGALALGAAVAAYQTFAAAGVVDGDVVSYVIEDGANWEAGHGTYAASGPTLTRTTILASSNGGAAIAATSGALVFVTPLAQDVENQANKGVASGYAGLDATAKVPVAQLPASYPTAQNVVTGSRALNTVYQNTTGRPMRVSVTLNFSGSVAQDIASVLTDSSATPSSVVAKFNCNTTVAFTSVYIPVTFFVLAGDYYEITSGTGPAIISWTEWY
jgi:hypothetical protein